MPINSTGHLSSSGFSSASGGNRGSGFGMVSSRGLVNFGSGIHCPGLPFDWAGHAESVCRLPIAWTSTELDWQLPFFPATKSSVVGCSLILLLMGYRTFANSKSPLAWPEVEELLGLSLEKRLRSDWARGRAMMVVKAENKGRQNMRRKYMVACASKINHSLQRRRATANLQLLMFTNWSKLSAQGRLGCGFDDS